MIHINSQALDKAFQLQDENPKWRGLSLRLYLEGKGCDGFVYGVCFDSKEDDDHSFFHYDKNNKELEIVVDAKTFEFVKDSEISWLYEKDKSGFLVTNPRHNNFRGKFYLRSFWQKKLAAHKNESPQTL